jgi:hypothetical protein
VFLETVFGLQSGVNFVCLTVAISRSRSADGENRLQRDVGRYALDSLFVTACQRSANTKRNIYTA